MITSFIPILEDKLTKIKNIMQRPVHTVVEKYFKKNLLTKESFSW